MCLGAVTTARVGSVSVVVNCGIFIPECETLELNHMCDMFGL